MDGKLTRLQKILEEMGSVMVAYSGGADSTFLAAVSYDVLKQNAMAVTGVSPSVPESEIADAKSLAQDIGIRHVLISTHEMSNPKYVANSTDRCFHCKDELYNKLGEMAKEEKLAFVADGCNVDDLGDFRPGRQAAERHAVRSPLVEAALSKAEIRELSRRRGLRTWDKPAMACLSSRIPYGTMVTSETLARIERAEGYLHSIGIRQVRVRDHREIARIETDAAGIEALISRREDIDSRFRALGYLYVTVDLGGYRSGSLNAVLSRQTDYLPLQQV